MRVRDVALLTLLLPAVAIAAAANTGAILYTFCAQQYCSDGAYPYAGLVMDSAHNLYGTTQQGGDSAYGTVFELSYSNGTWTHTVLHSFTGPDGANPVGPLVFDSAGNLYGVASQGGEGSGTVFELTPSNGAWTFNVIYTFHGGDDGAVGIDSGGLVFDSSGNLYGTTEVGGTTGSGTVFQLSPGNGGWTKTTLYSFQGGSDAGYPLTGVSIDSAGNLYGATVGGGSYGAGAVYEVSPSQGGWTEAVTYSFTGGNDGSYPEFGAPILDGSGNLYGTVAGGGAYGQGLVYQLTPSNNSWTETVLYTFTGGNDGGQPFAGLTFDAFGNLYGAAAYFGANGDGTIFGLFRNQGGWTQRTLHTFTGDDGKYPYGSVLFDSRNIMYGTTFWGGNLNCNNPPQGCGVAFELPPPTAVPPNGAVR